MTISTCDNCGGRGHFARECPSKSCGICGSDRHLRADCDKRDKTCDLCGKIGHLRIKCWAAAAAGLVRGADTTQARGRAGARRGSELKGGRWETKGRGKYSSRDRHRRRSRSGSSREFSPFPRKGAGKSSADEACFVCGRGGHWARECPTKGAPWRPATFSGKKGAGKSDAVCRNCGQKGMMVPSVRSRKSVIAVETMIMFQPNVQRKRRIATHAANRVILGENVTRI